MKRIVMILVAVMGILMFFSCSKEESKSEETTEIQIDGTTWKGDIGYKYNYGDGTMEDVSDLTLTFSGDVVKAKIKYSIRYYDEWAGGYQTESGTINLKGTYSYKNGKITLNVEDDVWGIDETWTGTVKEDNMTLGVEFYYYSSIDETVTLTKQ